MYILSTNGCNIAKVDTMVHKKFCDVSAVILLCQNPFVYQNSRIVFVYVHLRSGLKRYPFRESSFV